LHRNELHLGIPAKLIALSVSLSLKCVANIHTKQKADQLVLHTLSRKAFMFVIAKYS